MKLAAIVPLLALVGVAPVAAQQAPAGPNDILIADKDVYPESISADKAGRIYSGSVKGIVYRTTPKGKVAEPWVRPDAQNGILSILGVLVDEPRKTLWLCSSPMPLRTPPAVGVSALVALDLATGGFKARYPFPAPASACNDIAIAPDGTVFVTDTPNGRILTLTQGAKALTLFGQDQRLKGVDGIAFAGDGTLYVNNVQTNQLLRIDRGAGGVFSGVTILTALQPMAGPDGLRPIGGNRFLQAEGGAGRVTVVTITGDQAKLRTIREGLQSSPSVTLARGRVYSGEGKISYLFDPKLKGKDPGPFLLRAIPFDAK
jgi:sugar lactone lactonase YvrE